MKPAPTLYTCLLVGGSLLKLMPTVQALIAPLDAPPKVLAPALKRSKGRCFLSLEPLSFFEKTPLTGGRLVPPFPLGSSSAAKTTGFFVQIGTQLGPDTRHSLLGLGRRQALRDGGFTVLSMFTDIPEKYAACRISGGAEREGAFWKVGVHGYTRAQGWTVPTHGSHAIASGLSLHVSGLLPCSPRWSMKWELQAWQGHAVYFPNLPSPASFYRSPWKIKGEIQYAALPGFSLFGKARGLILQGMPTGASTERRMGALGCTINLRLDRPLAQQLQRWGVSRAYTLQTWRARNSLVERSADMAFNRFIPTRAMQTTESPRCSSANAPHASVHDVLSADDAEGRLPYAQDRNALLRTVQASCLPQEAVGVLYQKRAAWYQAAASGLEAKSALLPPERELERLKLQQDYREVLRQSLGYKLLAFQAQWVGSAEPQTLVQIAPSGWDPSGCSKAVVVELCEQFSAFAQAEADWLAASRALFTSKSEAENLENQPDYCNAICHSLYFKLLAAQNQWAASAEQYSVTQVALSRLNPRTLPQAAVVELCERAAAWHAAEADWLAASGSLLSSGAEIQKLENRRDYWHAIGHSLAYKVLALQNQWVASSAHHTLTQKSLSNLNPSLLSKAAVVELCEQLSAWQQAKAACLAASGALLAPEPLMEQLDTRRAYYQAMKRSLGYRLLATQNQYTKAPEDRSLTQVNLSALKPSRIPKETVVLLCTLEAHKKAFTSRHCEVLSWQSRLSKPQAAHPFYRGKEIESYEAKKQSLLWQKLEIINHASTRPEQLTLRIEDLAFLETRNLRRAVRRQLQALQDHYLVLERAHQTFLLLSSTVAPAA